MTLIVQIVLTPKNRPPLLYEEDFWEEGWREHLRTICPQCGQPAFSYLTRRWGRLNGIAIYKETTGSCSVCGYEVADCQEVIPG